MGTVSTLKYKKGRWLFKCFITRKAMIYTPPPVFSLQYGLTVQTPELVREEETRKGSMRGHQTQNRGQAAEPGESSNNSYHKVKCHVPERAELKHKNTG